MDYVCDPNMHRTARRFYLVTRARGATGDDSSPGEDETESGLGIVAGTRAWRVVVERFIGSWPGSGGDGLGHTGVTKSVKS